MTELSEYVLETLWQGGEFALYRGRQPGNAVSVLLQAPVREQQTPANLRWLEHAYALADELDPAWAARPIALTRHNGRTALLLHDPGGEPLARMLGPPLALARFLQIAVAATTALGQAHRHGLIHKDINPANLLLDASGTVRLMGFGIASRLPRERQAPAPPEIIAGTFAYMAPEQTGRMNRSIDARSDLYSLGITFYEMLTGVLPFTATDPMEWIHCHIARRPMPPNERVNRVPDPVQAIVLRLLAKSPEDRYQTAAGLEADLRACLTALEAHGRIDPFPLGEQDVSDRLVIPEKLYGREAEIDTLVAAFDRVVTRGTTELVLVSGYSGIGKSSVVNELHKALVPPRGLFAAGKFDQYKRDIPYATLAQAFQGLIRQLLSKDEAELDRWRDVLMEWLGPNGQLMINLVPELALIIGEQPPVPPLSAQEAQSRFHLAFQHFLGVFARPEHPLVLFLDDLQWLDAATLDVFERLATEPEVRHLLLVGAYRDNEVGPAHPLLSRLQIIRKAGRRVDEIVVGPLQLEDVTRMIGDALESQEVAPLARLVFDRTGGNPFFTIQFVSALADEDLLMYDSNASAWRWDIDRISPKWVTDNVVDLMVERLSRLSDDTLQALKQLACLGNSAKIASFRQVSEVSEEEMAAVLHEAVLAGLLYRFDEAYAFAHDRVHEAAYAILPEPERSSTHRRIALRLVAALNDTELDAQIFEIVSQFNRGDIGHCDLAERAMAASLNLRAGRRAKASAAYAAACGYLAVGEALLGQEGWTSHHELTFALALEHAECTFLDGQFDEAERMIATLLDHAATNVNMAAAYRLKIELHVVQSENPDAIDSGLAALRLFGIDVSAHPSREEVQREYENIWRNLSGRPIESLADLPAMSDPQMQAAMRILAELIAPAYFTDFNLMALHICQMVNLSLVHGAASGSNQGYAWLGWLMGPAFARYDDGYHIGKFACELISKRNVLLDMARVNHTMGLTSSWTQPLTTSIDWFRIAYRMGIEAGDVYFACYSSGHVAVSLLLRGHNLQQDADECLGYLDFARSIGFRDGVDLIVTSERTIASLRGQTRDLSDFSDAQFDEIAFEAELTGARMNIVVYWYWTRKIMLHFLSGDYRAALAAADKARPEAWIEIVQIQHLDYHYYIALALAARIEHAPAWQRDAFRARLAAHHEQLQTWVEETCSPTFPDKYALVSAEIARLEGRELEAERLYEDSIRLARQNGFLQNEGIANELAARFYAARGFEKIANTYLRDARHCYLRWGANGKVRQLEQAYPQLRQEVAPLHADGSVGTTVDALDIATVVKVSQAVSGEIDLEKLIDALMVTALEHAGGERGLLILPRDDELQIEAEAITVRDMVEVRLRQARIAPAELPVSILHYVARTQDSLLLEDASDQNPFSDDEYIRQNHCRSILCLPLIKQTRLIGILYLENSLTSGVFTPARTAVLKLLASQAAISVENARLYSDLQHTQAYLAEAQQLSHTGSFGWNASSGDIFWTEETFQIFELDRTTKPTLETILQRTHPEDVEIVQRLIHCALRDGTDWDLEHRLLMPDGSVKYLHVVSHAVRDGAGELEFVGAVMDVTASKLSQEALHKAQSELAHVSRVMTLGELASIAHEVNQPLAAIVTNIEASLRWLTHLPPQIDEVRIGLQRMIGDAKRAGDVIDRIRTLYKNVEPEQLQLDLNDVIEEVAKLVHREVASHQVSLRLDLATDLPAVLGDRIQLQQVILNFLVNGIQAMAGIDARPRDLLIRSRETADHQVLVAVRDSGLGIDPANADRLFDAFFTTKPDGMGLGLSICRSIIEAHGGRLWASSNDGPGATFQFALPPHEKNAARR